MPDTPTREMRYKIGDLLYLNDSLTRVSRKVTRVKIVGLYPHGGRNRYQCVLVLHAGRDKYTEIGPPRVIREEVLSPEPHCRRAGPWSRARDMSRHKKRSSG